MPSSCSPSYFKDGFLLGFTLAFLIWIVVEVWWEKIEKGIKKLGRFL